MASIQPSASLFLQNLDEKLKTDDLRRILYMLFSTHGKVLDVVARRGSMRGQAFVVFRDLQSATAARRREEGNVLLGKPMRISYAKAKSHATILHEDGPDALFRLQKGITDAKIPKLTVSGAEKANKDAKKAGDKRALEAGDDAEEPSKRVKINGTSAEDEEAAMEEDSDDDAGPRPNGASASEPHTVLHVTQIPLEITAEMMDELFKQHPGLSGIRYTPSRMGGTALVTYESVQSATAALEAQNGFQVAPGRFISVAYAVA